MKFLSNSLYGGYAVILAVVSIFTREIVTFIMLGFVFMALIKGSVNHWKQIQHQS